MTAGLRVLLTSVGLPGHLHSLVPLARSFLAAGHEVQLACPHRLAAASASSAVPIVDLGGDGMGDSFPSLLVEAEDTRARGRLFGEAAAHVAGPVRSLVRDWRPHLLVNERAEFSGPAAAREACIPSVEVRWSAGELEDYRRGAADVLGRHAVPPVDHLVHTWPQSAEPLPDGGGRTRVRTWAMRHDVDRTTTPVPLPRALRDRPQRPRICLTAGTVLPRSRPDGVAQLGRLATELSRKGYELVLAVDDRLIADLGPLPGSVLHAGIVPLAEALADCAAVVHHGGHGTSLAAVAAAVPQVLSPAFDDQYDNAAAVVAWGAGILAPGPEHVAEAVERVLTEPAVSRAARAAAARHAHRPPPAVVANDLVRRLARPARSRGSASPVPHAGSAAPAGVDMGATRGASRGPWCGRTG